MRGLARRTGDHLRVTAGYRGAFGIDGVLTADGFRPTELNARLSGGVASMARSVDGPLVNLLQLNLVSGRDPGVGAADLEAWLLPRVDAERFGKAIAMSARHLAADPFDVHVTWDGTALSRSWRPTGWDGGGGTEPGGHLLPAQHPAAGGRHPGRGPQRGADAVPGRRDRHRVRAGERRPRGPTMRSGGSADHSNRDGSPAPTRTTSG